MIDLKKHNDQKFTELHPKLKSIVKQIKIPHMIICGFRGEKDQNKAVAEGKSQLSWPNSLHNKFPSRAMDIMPWFEDEPHIRWDDKDSIHDLLIEILEISENLQIKLRFGYCWGDKNHVELDKIEA